MEITNEVQDRELISEGTYNAVCVSIIDLGTQKHEKFGDKKKISLTFEVQGETNSEGEPFYLYKQYTQNLGPKSNLGIDLKSWIGVTVGKGESFEIDKLLGKPALINVIHKETPGGTFANIASISSPIKGTKFLKPKAELLSFYMDGKELDVETFDKLNQFIQNKIAESAEFKALAEKRKSKPGGSKHAPAKTGKKK